MKLSSGTLLYRSGPEGLEVLVVHPSGFYNRRAPWSIPKGEVEGGASLEETARRETCEETGVVAGELWDLGDVVYRSRSKRVHCFAGEAPPAASPQCASWEVDRVEFVTAGHAKRILHRDQADFVGRLQKQLDG